MKKIFYFLACILIGMQFTACDKDGSGYPDGLIGGGDIECLVLNEGLINTNMGDISVVYRNGTVVPNVFRDVNNRPMGDVAQSITKINGMYFLAMNNSNKIEIVDPETFKSAGTILYEQAGYPRQIVSISPTEAIVSDLNQQLVRISTVPPYNEPLEYISIPLWVEYLVVVKNKLFGMTEGGLYVFDVNNIKGDAARVIRDVKNEENTKTCMMLVDKNEKIWALMNEKENGTVTGISLSRINPETEKVEKKFVLPIGDRVNPKPGEIIGPINYNRTDIDYTGTWVYFNVKTCVRKTDYSGVLSQQSVYRINVESGEFEHYRDLPGANMMYGFAVSPSGDVYLCDCLDYSAQRGYIRHYNKDESIVSYRVGVYPGQVYFPELNR